MNDFKKIVFICESKFSLLNTYLISESMYDKSVTKIVMLTNRFMNEKYMHYVAQLGFWDRVVFVDSHTSKNRIDIFNKEFIENERPDAIHYFSIGHYTTASLVNQGCEYCKIIYTEGSIVIHDPIYFEQSMKRKHSYSDSIPWYDNVSEIWTLEKQLFKMSNLEDKILKEISLEILKRNPQYHLDRLNILFQYNKELFEGRDIVVAPTYLATDSRGFSYGWLIFLQEQLCKILSGKKIIMKWHVTTNGDTTGINGEDHCLEYLRDYVEEGEIPLELYVLNAIINKENKTFINVGSSASVTSAIFASKLESKNIKIVDMLPLYKRNICYSKEDFDWVENCFEKANEVLTTKIHLINNFVQLAMCVDGSNKNIAVKGDKMIEEFRQNDYEASFVEFCIEKENLHAKNRKLQLYCEILCSLITLKNMGKRIDSIICEDTDKIAIYGQGVIGKQLYQCLDNSQIVLIDNNPNCADASIVTYDEYLVHKGYGCNCILFTIYEQQGNEGSIYKRLKMDFPDCKIISLYELNTLLFVD